VAPYPNPGPIPPAEPPKGTSPVIWLLALVGLGAFLCFSAAVAWAVYTGAGAATGEAAVAPSGGPAPRPKLPPAERHVPHHAPSILNGCTDDDVRALATGIDGAIDVGAPLYNAGNFAGCYHMYEGTAADVARNLSTGCNGPRRALEDGRTRALPR
jgi:hypothetical protein